MGFFGSPVTPIKRTAEAPRMFFASRAKIGSLLFFSAILASMAFARISRSSPSRISVSVESRPRVLGAVRAAAAIKLAAALTACCCASFDEIFAMIRLPPLSSNEKNRRPVSATASRDYMFDKNLLL